MSSQTIEGAHPLYKHCVVCHMDYTEKGNRRNSCVVPHTFNSDPEFSGRVIGWEKVYVYQAECCDDEDVEETGAGNGDFSGTSPCYTGKHTSNVRQVKKARLYNGKNIVSCEVDEDEECTREVLDYDVSNPCFDGYGEDGTKMNLLTDDDKEDHNDLAIGDKKGTGGEGEDGEDSDEEDDDERGESDDEEEWS